MSPLFNMEKAAPDFSIEQELNGKGFRYIAGIDEAGRGALAGPLGIGLVIYSCEIFSDIPDDIKGSVNDSKQLSHKKRTAALDIISRYALSCTSVCIPHTVIDSININRATELGIRRLIEKSPLKPDILMIDGNYRFSFDIPSISVIKGDGRSLTIASASIAAKVRRDSIMDMIDVRYPGYGFSGNKGYGTAAHLSTIEEIGYSSVHRKSYEPVKSMLERQGDLFDENF